MLEIPAFLGDAVRYTSIDTHSVRSLDGRELGRLTLTPLIKAHEAVRVAHRHLEQLQRIPTEDIFAACRRAAALLRGEWCFASLSKHDYCAAVSAATGLPHGAVVEEVGALADLLDNLDAIVQVQLPGPGALDHHGYATDGYEVGYYPAGRSLLVRVPGNIPTIASYWLIPLALKRPLILIPPQDDPFTHLILYEALREAAPWLAVFVQFLPCSDHVCSQLLHEVDQILMSQGHAASIERSPSLARKTQLIHYGRSKLLFASTWADRELEIAHRRMIWKHGRTCTGLTSIITTERALEFCERLASRIAGDEASWFDLERARGFDALIGSFVQHGDADDVTRRLDHRPRLQVHGARGALLPTVLYLVTDRSRAFGLELPFPFVTVIEASSEERIVELCRDTLILGHVGASTELVEQLSFEPSIRKVFGDEHVERGYHYLDPHEGYAVDFLYQKKAVLPAWRARRSMPR